MENSKPVASTDEPPQEESGWTSYFEEFLAQQRAEDNENSSTTTTSFSDQESFCSPSLVSDAASCAPLKPENRNQVPSCSSPNTEETMTIPEKTASLKKITRTEEINSHDDSLEDTASSSVASPKVTSLKKMDIKPRKREDNNGVEISDSPGKGGSDCCTEIQTEVGNEMTIEGYTELNKKGLCLVPLSILLNYLG